jgi:transposase
MAYVIELTDDQWKLVADLFDPPGRRGAPAQIPRRQMVNAMLFLARTGCQWRYVPERYGEWGSVWQQWRRWRANAGARGYVTKSIAAEDLRDVQGLERSIASAAAGASERSHMRANASLIRPRHASHWAFRDSWMRRDVSRMRRNAVSCGLGCRSSKSRDHPFTGANLAWPSARASMRGLSDKSEKFSGALRALRVGGYGDDISEYERRWCSVT